MKKLLFIAFYSFLFCSTTFAGIVICPDRDGDVTHVSESSPPQAGCLYAEHGKNGMDDFSFDALKTIIKTTPLKYLEIKGGQLVEKDQAAKDLIDQIDQGKVDAEVSLRGSIRTKLLGLGFTDEESNRISGSP